MPLRVAQPRVAPLQHPVRVQRRQTQVQALAALGMLLQMREHAGGGRSAIQIKNAKPAIKEILSVANFQQLMTID